MAARIRSSMRMNGRFRKFDNAVLVTANDAFCVTTSRTVFIEGGYSLAPNLESES